MSKSNGAIPIEPHLQAAFERRVSTVLWNNWNAIKDLRGDIDALDAKLDRLAEMVASYGDCSSSAPGFQPLELPEPGNTGRSYRRDDDAIDQDWVNYVKAGPQG